MNTKIKAMNLRSQFVTLRLQDIVNQQDESNLSQIVMSSRNVANCYHMPEWVWCGSRSQIVTLNLEVPKNEVCLETHPQRRVRARGLQQPAKNPISCRPGPLTGRVVKRTLKRTAREAENLKSQFVISSLEEPKNKGDMHNRSQIATGSRLELIQFKVTNCDLKYLNKGKA